MNDAGIYLKHYPASQEIYASPSVLTWRILVRVVHNLAQSIQSLDVSKNTGVDLEVREAAKNVLFFLRRGLGGIKSRPLRTKDFFYLT